MKLHTAIFCIVLAAALIGFGMSVFTVDEREQAIVLQLGQPVGEIKGPGLHFKIPFVQTVRYFDSRILSVDPSPEQMVIASSYDSPLVRAAGGADVIQEVNEDAGLTGLSGGEPIIVDTFARYKITDPLMFMKTLRTIQAANQRIHSIMNDSTRSVLGNTTMKKLLSQERGTVMREIKDRVNRKIKQDRLGIDVIDVRIVRADLTPELRQATVRRMKSELHERATKTRARGDERALEIRSTAEKERAIILAEAERDSQIIRGQGDQQAITIYAEAFSRDIEFYEFMRSLEAYRNTLAGPDTRLILSPDNQFFKYFKGGE